MYILYETGGGCTIRCSTADKLVVVTPKHGAGSVESRVLVDGHTVRVWLCIESSIESMVEREIMNLRIKQFSQFLSVYLGLSVYVGNYAYVLLSWQKSIAIILCMSRLCVLHIAGRSGRLPKAT